MNTHLSIPSQSPRSLESLILGATGNDIYDLDLLQRARSGEKTAPDLYELIFKVRNEDATYS